MRGIKRGGGGRKRDAVEKPIIAVLRKIGVTVTQITGAGIPDLLCWHPHTGLYLVDAKAEKGTLTPAQQRTERLMPFQIARTEQDALDIHFSHVRKYKQ